MRNVKIEYTDDDEEVIHRRGASGAVITVGENETTKLDSERTGTRVRDQGIWLLNHRRFTVLPNVERVLHNGYVMETLDVPALYMITDVKTFIRMMMNALSERLWFKEGVTRLTFDQDAHRAYVRKLTRDVDAPGELWDFLLDARKSVDVASLRVGLTHGDCILDNMAFRKPNTLVIIDPIPATTALPNVVASDVGRLIQSAVGYEFVRYTRTSLTLDHDEAVTGVLNDWMHRDFSVNEARAAIYFSIIHMLRGIRTTTPGTAQRDGLWYLVRQLQEVLTRWMR